MAAATVRHAPRRAVLADKPGHLVPRQSRHFRQIPANRPVAWAAQPCVANQHHIAPDKLVVVPGRGAKSTDSQPSREAQT